MPRQTKQQEAQQRLRSLVDQPEERFRYALQLLESEHHSSVVTEALAVVSQARALEAKPVLLQLYQYYDADGIKKDSGGYLRRDILGALLPIADQNDLELAERASATYEFAPTENAAILRAAGITLVQALDPALASYHCARLLNDPYTSSMSGEPAVSAAHLLANSLCYVPLYAYVLSDNPRLADVEAACLQHMGHIPSSALASLIAHYNDPQASGSARSSAPRYEAKSDIVLVALFDLLLTLPDWNPGLHFIKEFLSQTHQYEIYRYVVSKIIADHQPKAWNMLLSVAQMEQELPKVAILRSAFAFFQNDRAVVALLQELQKRL